MKKRNRSVPSSFQFPERKDRLFTRERNDCVSVFACVTEECNRSVPQSFFSPCHFSNNNCIYACAFGKNLIVPFFGPVLHLIACSHGNGAKRLRIVPLFVSLFYHSTFCIVPLKIYENRLQDPVAALKPSLPVMAL